MVSRAVERGPRFRLPRESGLSAGSKSVCQPAPALKRKRRHHGRPLILPHPPRAANSAVVRLVTAESVEQRCYFRRSRSFPTATLILTVPLVARSPTREKDLGMNDSKKLIAWDAATPTLDWQYRIDCDNNLICWYEYGQLSQMAARLITPSRPSWAASMSCTIIARDIGRPTVVPAVFSARY